MAADAHTEGDVESISSDGRWGKHVNCTEELPSCPADECVSQIQIQVDISDRVTNLSIAEKTIRTCWLHVVNKEGVFCVQNLENFCADSPACVEYGGGGFVGYIGQKGC